MSFTKVSPMRNNRFVAPLLLLIALVATGCGASKEQIALERANRPGPGLVRILNLTDGTISVLWKGRFVEENLAAGACSEFRSVGAGEQELEVTSNNSQLGKLKIEVDSKDPHTLAVIGGANDLRHVVIRGEDLDPTDTANVVARFLDESGKPVTGSVVLSAGDKDFDLTGDSAQALLTAGNYKIEGEGLATATGTNVEADRAYSLIVVQTKDGKRHAVLVQNTILDQVAMGSG